MGFIYIFFQFAYLYNSKRTYPSATFIAKMRVLGLYATLFSLVRCYRRYEKGRLIYTRRKGKLYIFCDLDSPVIKSEKQLNLNHHNFGFQRAPFIVITLKSPKIPRVYDEYQPAAKNKNFLALSSFIEVSKKMTTFNRYTSVRSTRQRQSVRTFRSI